MASIWDSNAPKISASKLEVNLKTEVCVIGAGITGLSTGLKLARAGKKVVIVDKGKVGFGETGVTTALLSVLLDDRIADLQKLQGHCAAAVAYESHLCAINLIANNVRHFGIDCDFETVDCYLFTAKKDDEKLLDEEIAVLKILSISSVEKVKHGPKGADLGPGLKYSGQAQFHPLKYLAGLAQAFQKAGGKIYQESFAHDIEENGEKVTVKMGNGHTVEAEQVVVATHTPFNDRYAMHTKQTPYRTYVIGVKVDEGAIPNAMICDTAKPYHYLRQYNSNETGNILIVGGEDHITGQAPEGVDPYKKLLEWTRKTFPQIGNSAEAYYKWSGQIIEPIDGLAYIGRNPHSRNVYIATGFSGSGMTYGTLAGEIIGGAILGRPQLWSHIYNPSRKNVRALKSFIEGGMNVAQAYYLNKPKADEGALAGLASGSGIVIKEHGKNIAVYKEKSGKICKYSAVCPHLGCIVRWNGEAHSFDCPCHGSRFDTKGRVLNGPADKSLEPVEV